jgi:hypothetical protein
MFDDVEEDVANGYFSDIWDNFKTEPEYKSSLRNFSLLASAFVLLSL